MPLLAIAPLLIILTAYVGYGMVLNARAFSGGYLGWFTSLVKAVIAHSQEIVILREIVNLSSWIAHHVGAQVLATQAPAIRWMVGLNQWVGSVQSMATTLSGRVVDYAAWLKYRYIPRQIAAHTRPLTRAQRAAEAQAAAQAKTIAANAHAVPQIAKSAALTTVPTAVRPFVWELRWARTHWKVLTSLVAAPGLAELPFRLPKINFRLNRLEKGLLGLAGVGFVARALTKLGVGGVRCQGSKKYLNRLCGMDSNLLNALLADTLAIFGTISLVELAKGMQTLTPAAQYGIGSLIREAPADFTKVPEQALTDALSLIPGF